MVEEKPLPFQYQFAAGSYLSAIVVVALVPLVTVDS